MPLLASLRHEARLFAVALQFLTRVPVPAFAHYDPAWLNRCVRHFPLVGVGIGAFGAAVLAAAAAWWPAPVAAVLAVSATAWLTVAFHEDGLADSADALWGHAPRDRALAIMKDSRIGTYGALALVLVLLLRATALHALLARGTAWAAGALVASHVLARTGAVVLMASLPYAGDADHAKAKPLAQGVRRRDALVATTLATATTATSAWTAADSGACAALAVSVLTVAAVIAWMRRMLRRRLGGYTGDTLGAAEQLSEAAVLLAWLALSQHTAGWT